MIVKFKEIEYDIENNRVSDYNLFLYEFLERLNKHRAKGRKIHYVENNVITVETELGHFQYYPIVLM